jgi:hypothetical protein
MSVPKLFYFDGRGRGETARLIFAAAGQQFENCHIETPEHPWPGSLKAKMPFGTVVFNVYRC